MSSSPPSNRRQTSGSGYPRQQRDQWGWDAGYGQPATDSERPRQFARAYDEQVRRDTYPAATQGTGEMAEVTLGRGHGHGHGRGRTGAWMPLVVGLAVFVLLLSVAMGMGLALMHP